MRIKTEYGYYPVVESDQINGEEAYYCAADEDWCLACVYLTDDEIAKYGLLPTDFNGGEYDYIHLPKRDDDAEPGEHLVAAFGGMFTEICEIKSYCDSTTSSGAYYAEDGWQDSNIKGDTGYLPDEIQQALFSAITDKYGMYDDLACPYYDDEQGWIEHPDYQAEE